MLNDVKRHRVRLENRGVEIALLDWQGSGPLALLHHANGFCAATLALVAELLRAEFRVVAMDARGHGDSSKPENLNAYEWSQFPEDLAAVAQSVCDELGFERVALGLGHSFGGTATLAASASHPDLFERVVCVDPVILPPEVLKLPERREHSSRMVEGARGRRREWPDRQAAFEHFAERSLFKDWVREALELYVNEGLAEQADGSLRLKCPPEVEAKIFGSADGFDPFARTAGNPTSCLILWAAHGNFRREVYERLASGMKHAQVKDLEGGHLAPMECPERVARAVLEFAQR